MSEITDLIVKGKPQPPNKFIIMGDLVRRAVKEYMLHHPVKGAEVVDPSIKALAGSD